MMYLVDLGQLDKLEKGKMLIKKVLHLLYMMISTMQNKLYNI